MDISMDNVSQIFRKVRQAHWRVQRQWIGLFLLGLVAVSMVAGIYLNITVRATLAGREVQILEPMLSDEQRTNSDLETQLAGLNAIDSMHQRAQAMGFQPAAPEDIIYVPVAGYAPHASVDMSQPSADVQPLAQTPVILPAYTESLLDWIARVVSISAGGQP